VTQPELDEAHRKIEKLEAELARTREVQDDLWAHDVYIRARKKMMAPVLGILGLLSVLGLWTAYDFYRNLLEFSVNAVEDAITKKIDAKVDDMVREGETKLQAEFTQQIATLVESQKETVQAKIAALDESVSEAEQAARQANRVAKEANDAATWARQLTLAAGAARSPRARRPRAGVVGQADLDRAIPACAEAARTELPPGVRNRWRDPPAGARRRARMGVPFPRGRRGATFRRRLGNRRRP